MKKLIIFAMAMVLPFLAQAQVDRDQVFSLDPAITDMGYMYYQGAGLGEMGIYDPETGNRLALTLTCSGGTCTSATSVFVWAGSVATNSEGISAVINRNQFAFYAIGPNGEFLSTVGSQNEDPAFDHWNQTYPPITLPDGTVISFAVTFTMDDDATQSAQINIGGLNPTQRDLCPNPIDDDPEPLQCGDTLDNGDAYEEPDPDQPWRNACYDPSQFCQTEPRLNCRFVQPSCCGA